MSRDDPEDATQESTQQDLVARLVCEVIERFEDEGPSAVDAVCAQHPGAAERVRRRIDSLRQLGLLPGPDEVDGGRRALPEQIGAFQVLREIGHGGMGVVFEAQQDNPRRRVALKVIRGGFPSATALRRFATETQLLGLLQHAHIAQIYEAGTTEVGGESVPYFAMEFIDGVPVDEAVQREALGLRERLALIATIAEAIDYAHGRGVVHRDLKPGNVLLDARGEPKILDFGLARASDPELRFTSVDTRSGQVLGTLPYMSPEQARGDSNSVDARSDVYSLGVLAHELLTGQLPYPVKGKSTLEAVRIICEVEPLRLSLSERSLRGDVETILRTAMEKEPARRYASAGAMAADLRRHLADEPILARPASRTYMLRKLVRRNRGLFAGIAAAFVLLIAGTTVSTAAWWKAQVATRRAEDSRVLEVGARRAAERALAREEEQRRQADAARQVAETARAEAEEAERATRRQAEIARSVTTVLTDMLNSANPWRRSEYRENARDTLVVDILDATASLLDGQNLDPQVEAQVRQVLAQTYEGLGMYDKSLAQAQRVHELNLELYGTEHGLSADSAHVLAMALSGLERNDEARVLLEQSVGWYRTRDRFDSEHLTALSDLALLRERTGEFDEALALLHEARLLLEQSEDPRVLRHQGLIDHNLGSMLREHGRRAEALPFVEKARAAREEQYGLDHPRTLAVANTLGLMLFEDGQLEEARALQEGAVEQAIPALGEGHPLVGTLLVNLAMTQLMQRRTEDAEASYRRLVQAAEDGAAYNAEVQVRAASGLANVLVLTGRIDEGLEAAYQAVNLGEELLGPEDAMTAVSYGVVAYGLMRQNDVAGAVEWFERSVESYEQSVGPDASGTVSARDALAQLLMRNGQAEAAAPLARQNVEAMDRVFPVGHPQTVVHRRFLATCLIALEQFEDAELELLQAFEHSESLHGERAPETLDLAQRLVELYVEMRLDEDAARFRERLSPAEADDDSGGRP